MPASAVKWPHSPTRLSDFKLRRLRRTWNAAGRPVTLCGMTTPDALRHRLLEGVLLRLARRPDAAAFVLRGGVLMRHWVRPDPRPADDLDLVATFSFDAGEAARRFLSVLADTADDGVNFDTEFVRVEAMFLDTGSPGVRVFITGTAGGAEEDFHVDLTFGPPPRPDPVLTAIPTASGAVARVWACRPETVVAQKVQALQHLGLLGWRPKDLDDLRRLLDRVPVDPAALRGAVAAYLGDIGRTPDDARALFGPASWWGMKLCSARWLDFAAGDRGRGVPRDLAVVVAGIAGRLLPALEGEP